MKRLKISPFIFIFVKRTFITQRSQFSITPSYCFANLTALKTMRTILSSLFISGAFSTCDVVSSIIWNNEIKPCVPLYDQLKLPTALLRKACGNSVLESILVPFDLYDVIKAYEA